MVYKQVETVIAAICGYYCFWMCLLGLEYFLDGLSISPVPIIGFLPNDRDKLIKIKEVKVIIDKTTKRI